MEFNAESVKDYFWWINERHYIYEAKLKGFEWPWTEDKILQTYAFTNPYRENDKVTVWLRENWKLKHANHPCLYLNLAMFRQFNWPQTMELTGFVVDDPSEIDGETILHDWNPEKLTAVVEAYQATGAKIWTGAYMIRGQAKTEVQWSSKADYMFHDVLEPLWETDEPDWEDMTLEAAVDWWKQFNGFGHFLSYEVVTDMRHTRYLRDAPDIMTWANPGPGAIRGVHRVMGWPAKRRKEKQAFYIQTMRELLAMSPEYLWPDMPALEMRDVEHSLCEYDKYMRVKTGEGRPRSKYTPPHKR